MIRKTILFLSVTLIICLVSCSELSTSTGATPAPSDAPVRGDPDQFLSVVYLDTWGNIWLWRDTGDRKPVQLTSSVDAIDVQISTDGLWVAYLTNASELWAIRTDNSYNPIKLVDRTYLDALFPHYDSFAEIFKFEFVPNTYEIYFQVFAAGDICGVDLFHVHADIGLITRVLEPGQGGNANYFSPDGKWVTIAYPNELILSDVSGENPRSIFSLPAMHGFSSCRGPEAIWRSDSAGFYIVVPGYTNTGYSGQASMYYVPVDERSEVQLTFMSLPYDQSFIARDGQRLAYLVDDSEVVNLHIVTKNEDQTKDEIYISEAGVGFFGWNPDGEHFVIWRANKYNPLIATIDTIPVSLIGDPNQPISSFQWVAQNCFLFTRKDVNDLVLRLLPEDPADTTNVFIASNIQAEKYDFTGGCNVH